MARTENGGDNSTLGMEALFRKVFRTPLIKPASQRTSVRLAR